LSFFRGPLHTKFLIFTFIITVFFRRILYFLFLVLTFAACTTKKNTVVTRSYHNLTCRFNGLYYSTLSLDDGFLKIEKSHKADYNKILPIYIYPTQENVKNTFPEFDKTIKKSSLSIQKHAIKDGKGAEIPSSGKWIDNNWINIGIAQFYKREFFSAIETFEYVLRTYTKSDDKFVAALWLIRTNNEIGSVTASEKYLNLLKNEKNLPHGVKNELPVVYADYYTRRGQYTEAVAKLMEATRNTNLFKGISKKKRARYSFIIAQIAEKQNDTKRAAEFYNRTIHLKPPFEMAFYSKIKIAGMLDVKKMSSAKTKKDLLKMASEFKNTEYFDVIYFTLGSIEEKERNVTQAQTYYKKSVRTSVSNPSQKALSFLRLAEINFDLANYQPAEAYYDSTIATLPIDHVDYHNIIARKKTLETLVTQIKTISREDSLQRIAKMPEDERNKFIDKMIEAIEKEQERLLREMEAASANNANNLGGGGLGANTMQGSNMNLGGGAATFYFYNPTAAAFGIGDFTRKWGNRKLEDDWRRSGKAMVLSDMEESVNDSTKQQNDAVKKTGKGRDFYLKDLPLNDTLLAKSNEKLIKAFYVMGSVYNEELNNPKKTISTFEELNTRFPNSKYALNSYYGLYRIYQKEKNTTKENYYKEKILSEFPESEFALLIKNPDYAQELNSKKSEVEDFYTEVLKSYREANYQAAYSKSNNGIKTFGKNDYSPKFEFIRAMSSGKLQGVDTLEQNLKLLVAKYPQSDVTPLSKDILASISKQKTPEVIKPLASLPLKKDTFTLNFEATHLIIALTPDNTKTTDVLKANIANFNSIFFSTKKFEMSSSLFGKNQLVILKPFTNAKEAMDYHANIISDPDLYRNGLIKEEIEILPISADNLSTFYRNKDFESYKIFYKSNYETLKTRKD